MSYAIFLICQPGHLGTILLYDIFGSPCHKNQLPADALLKFFLGAGGKVGEQSEHKYLKNELF